MLNKKISIIGYSGHSYLCIETALKLGFSIIGYYDIEKKKQNPYNLLYLGKENKEELNSNVFITIGDNITRKKVFEKLKKKIKHLETKILHQSSIISDSATIKKQTFVSSGAVINAQVNVNKGCIINSGAIIEHECSIGDFSHIGPGTVLAGNVSVGKYCLIGANSVIKQGVKIGNNVIIGAGSVVLKDIPDNFTVAGNPSKLLN